MTDFATIADLIASGNPDANPPDTCVAFGRVLRRHATNNRPHIAKNVDEKATELEAVETRGTFATVADAVVQLQTNGTFTVT